MSNQTLQNLGDAIFGDIDNNPFLNELYDNILYNYAITKFNLTDKRQMREVDVVSALRFADLLSKSTHAVNRDKHKMWAQEIIILLYSLYPDNPNVKFYAGSVFANTENYQARRIIDSDFYGTTALERFFAEYQNDYLTIPAAPELRFFGAQKNAYDHLSDDHFSYSGPTSMGKSFLMRMYIKDQIQHGVKMNFALIVPTKALINEIYKQVIDEDLKNLLSEHNYKVVTAAGDIALEGKHNFILVLTPERLLYLLISKPDLQIDYLFIDAYGIIGLNSKGSANKGFLKLSPILFSPQMRLMIDLRRKHAQNEDLSAKRSAACNFGSTVSDVVPSHLLQRQSIEYTPDVDLHRSTVRYPKDVSLACAA